MFEADILERQLRDPAYGIARRKSLLSRAEARVERELQHHAEAQRAASAALLTLFRERWKLRALASKYGRSRAEADAVITEPWASADEEDQMTTIDRDTEFKPAMEGLVKKSPLSYAGPFKVAEPIPMSEEEALALSHADRVFLIPGYMDLALLAQRQWMDQSVLDKAVRRAAANGIIGETLADDLCGAIISEKVITSDVQCKRFAELRRAHRESLRSGAQNEGLGPDQ